MTTPFDNTQAFTEGWGIFDESDQDASFRAEYGEWALDRLGEGNTFGPEVFGEDADEAWRFVVTKALQGSDYHVQAIRFLRKHNPKEIEFIRAEVPEIESLELICA